MGFEAVILAAGVGSRLRPWSEGIPKCLVSVGHETILGRAVRLLHEAGCEHLVVSTGYQSESVREALAGAVLPVSFVHNSDYATTQNVVSLHRAMGALRGGEVVKLDGDVVFGPAVLSRVLEVPIAEGEAAVAVDDAGELSLEAMKVLCDNGRARRFGKALEVRECAGESIGIERFGRGAVKALARVLNREVSERRTGVYYEEGYNVLVGEGMVMRCAWVGSLPWTEVDDGEDLRRARELVAAGF